MIPKRLIFFAIILQSFLSFLHWLVYLLIITIFPGLAAFQTVIMFGLLFLSLVFPIASLVSYNHDNWLLRLIYVGASVWLVAGFYLLLFSSLLLLVSALITVNLIWLGWLSLSLSLGLTVYGLINARVLRQVNITVKLPGLPEFWRGKTAVMVSDLHLGQILRPKFAHRIVKKINSLNPEIVFVPGDFYDGVHADFKALAETFKTITAPQGCYFCSGNHEMFAGMEKCEQALDHAGIKILDDAKTEIHGLQIAGLAYKNETDSTVAKRLENLNLNKTKPSILLKHVPNHLTPVREAGINLQLSGHTHLGQIWPFRYLTKKVFKGYDYGFKKLGRLHIFTSCGVGTWGPPIRIFTKAEIIKITFQ